MCAILHAVGADPREGEMLREYELGYPVRMRGRLDHWFSNEVSKTRQ